MSCRELSMGRATDRLLLQDCRLPDGVTADVLIVSDRSSRSRQSAIVPGAAADLCLWPCASAWQLVAAEPEPVGVLVGGDFVRPAH